MPFPSTAPSVGDLYVDAQGVTYIGTLLGSIVVWAVQPEEASAKSEAEDVASLLADTSFTYSTGTETSVAEGAILKSKAENFSYKVAASTASDHHITTAGGVKLYALPDPSGFVSIDQFGAQGDDAAVDNAIPIQTALNNFRKVLIPPDTYRTKTVYFESNQEVVGTPGASILKRFDNGTSSTDTPNSSMYVAATYAYSQGDEILANNKRKIRIRGIRFEGRRSESGFGYQPFSHNVAVNATSDITFEDCEFTNFRGDGLYVGSGTNGGIERHNENVKIIRCKFDGDGYANRNGLSIIDCDGLIVDACEFRNIGSSSLSESVGAIDFEPDNSFSIYRNVVIKDCAFYDINQTNTAAITFFNGQQTVAGNIRDLTVEGCYFEGCYRSIFTSSKDKSLGDVTDNLVVRNNEFVNSTLEDISLAFHRFKLIDNTHRLIPSQSASHRGGELIGQVVGGNTRNAIDCEIRGNRFEGLRPQFGAIAIFGARGAEIKNNTFSNISGRPVTLISSATAVGARYLEDIHITDNMEWGSTVPFYSDSTPSPITDIIVRCIFERNKSKDKVVVNGSPQPFVGSSVSSAPTTGTWNRGDIVWLDAPAAGNVGFACAVSGTFGTIASVTCDATNGSVDVTNVSDMSQLREGQVITIDGSVQRQILSIDRTTNSLKLAIAYAGTTGNGLSVNWFSPTFVSI